MSFEDVSAGGSDGWKLTHELSDEAWLKAAGRAGR